MPTNQILTHHVDEYTPLDQSWMDKLAVENRGAMCVGGEEVDQHNDLHLIVEGEPPVYLI